MDIRAFWYLIRDCWKQMRLVTPLAVSGGVVLTTQMTPRYGSSVTSYMPGNTSATNPFLGSVLTMTPARPHTEYGHKYGEYQPARELPGPVPARP